MFMLTLRLVWETFAFLIKLPLRLFWVAQEWGGIHYAADAYEEYLAAHGNPLPDEKHLKKALALRAAAVAHEKYNEAVAGRPPRGYSENFGAGVRILSLLFLFSAVGSLFAEYVRPKFTTDLWPRVEERWAIPAQWVEWACWNSAHWLNALGKSRAYADRVSPERARPDLAFLTPAGQLHSVQTHREIQYRPGLHVLDTCGGEWTQEELSAELKAKIVPRRSATKLHSP